MFICLGHYVLKGQIKLCSVVPASLVLVLEKNIWVYPIGFKFLRRLS